MADWTTPIIPVDAPIAPRNPDDTYPTAFANYIKGGHHTAATTALRDAISADLLEVGMTCAVAADSVTYKLTSTSPVTWAAESSGGITINTLKIVGRTTAGSGASEEIAVSADLSLSAQTLGIATAVTDGIDNIAADIALIADDGFDGGTWA